MSSEAYRGGINILFTSVIFVLLGCVILAYSADRFVIASSAIASNFGVPPLFIGIVLVGFATSFPEILVSAISAWQGASAMGIGNAVGSNIANIGLVIGVAAIVRPISLPSTLLRRELPALFIAMLFAWCIMMGGYLGHNHAILLLILMVVILVWMLRIAMKAQKVQNPTEDEVKKQNKTMTTNKMAIVWFLASLVLLLVSSRMLIYGAVNIARVLGISELVIGLTVIAVGTTLPELAASVASVLRKEDDLAMGNLIGSNMFNILAVLAMPGLIRPSTVSSAVIWRDFPVMFLLSILFIGMAYGYRKLGNINRFDGAGLLIGYLAYLIYLYTNLS